MTISIPLISCLLLIALTSAVIGMDLHLYNKRLTTLSNKLKGWEHQLIPRHRMRLRLDELENLQEGTIANSIEKLLIGSEALVRQKDSIDIHSLISQPKDNDGRNLLLKVLLVILGIVGALLGPSTDIIHTIIPLSGSLGALWILSILNKEAHLTAERCAGLINTWVCTISTPNGQTAIGNQGEALDEAVLQKVLQRELNPILTKILDLSSDTSEQTSAFIESASNAQVEGIRTLITQVQTSLETSIGSSITNAANQFAATVSQQQESVERWQASVADVSSMLEGMQGSADVLGQAASQLSQSTEPISQSASSMLQVSDRLQQTLSLFETASSTYAEANTAMLQSHNTLQRGTEAYLEAGATARELLSDLRETHELASQRIAAGVDEAILGSMREAGLQLQNLQQQQTESLEQWHRAAEQLQTVVDGIQQSTTEMSGAATVLRESTEPTVTASSAFLEAAQTLGNTMPQIEQAAQAHEHARQAMETTAQMLAESSRGYTESTTLICNAVNGLQDAQAETMTQIQTHFETHVATALINASTRVQEASSQFETQSQNAAQTFYDQVLSSCNRLQETTQNLNDMMRIGTETLQSSLESSHSLFESRFEAVANAQLTHMTDTAQQLGLTLTQLSSELNNLGETQTVQAESWTTIMNGLSTGLQSLEQSTLSLDTLVTGIESLIGPTATAASDFRSASETLNVVFPNIEQTAESYSQLNQSLSTAAQALDSSGQTYAATEESMLALLGQVQEAMTLQQQSNSTIASTLDSAASTVQSFAPLAEQLQHASTHVLEISSQTATAVERISEVTTAQQGSVEQMSQMSQQVLLTLNAQAESLNGFSTQIQQLHHTLTAGVDAFSTALPASVDQTLLRFDVALGEGVARLGSAVERLREAMDDLIERVESMLDTRRRK